MSSRTMSLKGKIKHYAKSNNIAAQVVLQNYMFECFLARLSVSKYSDKFVIKGGMLVAAIVGLDTRSTMDLDTTLRNLPLTEEQIWSSINDICEINLQDDVIFELKSVAPIRKDDIYGGYCVKLEAKFETIITPLAIDISTGDVMTPNPVKYEFVGIFDENVHFHLWGYNIETVLAEKVETILSRGIFSTRPRDFYDVYILSKTQNYDREIFRNALNATAKHRGSLERISDFNDIIQDISESNDLKIMWTKYQKKFIYAKDILYEDIMEAIRNIVL